MDHSTDYIFSINTGRSGSDYLKTLFEHVAGCQAFHEPRPVGNGKAMRRYARGHTGAMKAVAQQKAEIVRNVKRHSRLYVETNHCFIKGFGWFIPELLGEEKIGVIILKRDEPEIVTSMLRINCSPLVPYGRQWITTPDKSNPLVTPPRLLFSARTTYLIARIVKFLFRGTRFLARHVFRTRIHDPRWLTDYELECVRWYVRETAAQAEAFKRRFPRIKCYEVDIDDLNSLEHVRAMLAHFGCEAKESLSEAVGNPTNLKRHP